MSLDFYFFYQKYSTKYIKENFKEVFAVYLLGILFLESLLKILCLE